MVNDIQYPTKEKVIEYNLLALTIIKVKKADQPKVLSNRAINSAIEECRQAEGDIYDKAVSLLKGLIQKHPFASGNRRTAFIVTKEFLLSNNAAFRVKNDPAHARVMQGIREDYYTHEEYQGVDKKWQNTRIQEIRKKKNMKLWPKS